MKKSIIAILMLMALCSGAVAQDNITAITYQPSVPLGDLEEYIGKTSWIGWGLEGRRFRNSSSHLTVGFAFAWHVFDDKLFGTQELENGAFTGTQRRWVNSLPFLLTSNYYFNRKDGMKPFIGAGAGVYYIEQRFDVGVWTREAGNWHFGLMGEAGLQLPLGDFEGFASAKYYYAFPSGDSISGEDMTYQYLTVAVGVAYARW